MLRFQYNDLTFCMCECAIVTIRDASPLDMLVRWMNRCESIIVILKYIWKHDNISSLWALFSLSMTIRRCHCLHMSERRVRSSIKGNHLIWKLLGSASIFGGVYQIFISVYNARTISQWPCSTSISRWRREISLPRRSSWGIWLHRIQNSSRWILDRILCMWNCPSTID